MTIARAYPPGWGTNNKLTSPQANQLDVNTTYALDKRSGQTDTLASVVTVTGALTVNGGLTVGANPLSVTAAATFSGGLTISTNPLSVTAAATLSGTTTLSGAVTASNFTMSGTNRVKLAGRSITRVVPALFRPNTANWTEADNAVTFQTTDALFANGDVSLVVPDQATITQVRAWIEPASGHGASLVSPPFLALMQKASTSGITSQLASTFDTYGGAGSYETVHAVTISGLGIVISRSAARLSLHFQSEFGTGAVAGLKLHAFDVTYTVTSMDDGL
jgi:hypothetical protein